MDDDDLWLLAGEAQQQGYPWYPERNDLVFSEDKFRAAIDPDVKPIAIDNRPPPPAPPRKARRISLPSESPPRASAESADFLIRDDVNPYAVDATVRYFGAHLLRLVDGSFVKSPGGFFVMRSGPVPGFLEFACTRQGYCTIVRRLERPHPEGA